MTPSQVGFFISGSLAKLIIFRLAPCHQRISLYRPFLEGTDLIAKFLGLLFLNNASSFIRLCSLTALLCKLIEEGYYS